MSVAGKIGRQRSPIQELGVVPARSVDNDRTKIPVRTSDSCSYRWAAVQFADVDDATSAKLGPSIIRSVRAGECAFGVRTQYTREGRKGERISPDFRLKPGAAP